LAVTDNNGANNMFGVASQHEDNRADAKRRIYPMGIAAGCGMHRRTANQRQPPSRGYRNSRLTGAPIAFL
jgi:hypothetical protein